MPEHEENAPVFVGVAMIYSYLGAKVEEGVRGGGENFTGLVLGRELTPGEKSALPADLQGFRCYFMEKKG